MNATERRARARLARYTGEEGLKLRAGMLSKSVEQGSISTENEKSAAYIPTPEQIIADRDRIKAGWSRTERARRNLFPNPECEIHEPGKIASPGGYGGFTSDRIGAVH